MRRRQGAGAAALARERDDKETNAVPCDPSTEILREARPSVGRQTNSLGKKSLDNNVLLFRCQIRMHGQAHDADAAVFGDRKGTGRIMERGKGRLPMQGGGVVNSKGNIDDV